MSGTETDKKREKADQEQDSRCRDLLDIRRRIRFHQAMGIEEYPLNDGVKSFLKMSGPGRVHRPGVGKQVGRKKPVAIGRPAETEDGKFALAALEQDIQSCTLCPLAANRQGTVSGRGNPGVALMVVGDWSRQEHNFSGDVLFSREEDDMLWKMMAAIKLSKDNVYVTSCIKCCPGTEGKPDAEAEQRCFSYLAREIAAVKPQILCAMGEVAARLLLGTTVPLVRLRGKFGAYRYQSSGAISVMPTFHPRFLLRNPEMKKATWNDLQMIKRSLDDLVKSRSD